MTLPQTAFEAQGAEGRWTSLDDERIYIDALLDEVPEITQKHIGYGAGGAEMYAYTLGSGPVAALWVAQQHGAELSGREALLTRLRDWATSTDPAIVDYLDKVTVVFIPTAHPDNITTRFNPNGVNLNREHVRVQEPEAVAMHAVIRDYQPSLIADLHEYLSSGDTLLTGRSVNPNIAQELRSLSGELEEEIQGAVESNGGSWGEYRGNSIIGPDYLHNSAGLRHAVGSLVETARIANDWTNTNERWTQQLWVMDRTREWHHDNLSRISDACAASRQAAAKPQASVELVMGEDESGPVVAPAPNGYSISPAGRAALASPEALFGIPVEPHGAGFFVPARHDARWMVHYLLDEEAEERLATGIRAYGEDRPPVEGVAPLIPIPGITSARYRTGGVSYEVEVPVSL